MRVGAFTGQEYKMRRFAAVTLAAMLASFVRKRAIRLSTGGSADEATLQALRDALARQPPLNDTGAVIFRVALNVGT